MLDPVRIAGLIALAALFLASSTTQSPLWGIHSAAFLAPPARLVLFLAAATAVSLAPLVSAALDRRFASSGGVRGDRGTLGGRAAAAVGLALLGAALWHARERFYFLGDAKAMLGFYEARMVGVDGHAFLTTLVNYNLFRALEALSGATAENVIRAASVAAGVAFAALAFRVTARTAANDAERRLARALLLSGGALALFAGYIENYAFVLPAILLYVASGVEAAEGRRGLAQPFLLLLLAMGFHFVGFTMIPSFALLAARRPAGRERAVGAALTAALLTAAAGLARLSRDPGLGATDLGRHLLFLPGDPFYRAYGFLSPAHLAEAANEVLLLLPFGAPLLLWAVARRRARRALAEPSGAFLGVACAGALGFLLAFNAEIGVARDWDLFAFIAVPLALLAARLAGAALAPERPPAPAPTRGLAMAALAVQLANTIPFIWTSHDPRAGLERARAILAADERLSPHARSYGAAFVAPALAAIGRWPEALPYYETIVRYRPNDGEAHLGLAGALVTVGREDEGVAAARRSIELNPADPRPHSILGRYHYRHLRYVEAEVELRRALELGARDPKTLGDCGIVLANLGRHAEALEVLEASLRGDPGDANVRLHLGRVYELLERRDDALATYRALAEDPRVGPAARALLARLEAAR